LSTDTVNLKVLGEVHKNLEEYFGWSQGDSYFEQANGAKNTKEK
jgi:hypothetical protein